MDASQPTQVEVVLHAVTQSHDAKNDVPDCCPRSVSLELFGDLLTYGQQMGSCQSILLDTSPMVH